MSMLIRTAVFALTTLAVTLINANASASILGITPGHTHLTTNPASSVPGALQGTGAFAWDEQQGLTVSSLSVNGINNPGGNGGPSPGAISGIVDSHMLHFDPLPGSTGTGGIIFFNNPIIGYDFLDPALDSGDAIFGALGNPNTVYPTNSGLRSVTASISSWFTVSGSHIKFTFNNVGSIGDILQVRVYTGVPAPGVISVAGLAGIAALRRRRSMA